MWTLPWMRSGSKPTFSMMSISPQVGQPTWPMFVPSIQMAGHVPLPVGSLARTSTRPYRNSKRPRVTTRADV